MRKEIIIRMQPDSDKGRAKALKVAASVSGVESVTVAGESRDMLLLIGDGVDAGKLTRKLKKEVGEADILELRTLPATGSTSSALAPGSSTVVTQSAYQRHAATPGRSVPGGSRIECPFAAAPPRSGRASTAGSRRSATTTAGPRARDTTTSSRRRWLGKEDTGTATRGAAASRSRWRAATPRTTRR